MECRGWDSDQATEFTRQRDKLLHALSGLNADIIGLNELENSTGVEPLASIVSGLPGYDYIDTGTIGTDAIKVGMIYRPAVVTPVGAFQILDSTDDPRFIDTKSRPSLAQTFEVNATGARFTVVVNHLKSKGSDCDDVGDPDLLRRSGQLQPDPPRRGRSPGGLARHRPDRQRRPRLHHHGRPELLCPGRYDRLRSKPVPMISPAQATISPT